MERGGGGVPPGPGSSGGSAPFSFPQVPAWAADAAPTASDNPVAAALQERLGQVLGMAGPQTRRGAKRPLHGSDSGGAEEPGPKQPRTVSATAPTAEIAAPAPTAGPSLERARSDAIVHISVVSQVPKKAAPRSQRKAPAPRTAAPAAGTAASHRVPTKSIKAVPSSANGTFTSLYRGVTRHRLTGRYEAHFWDSSYVRQQPQQPTGATTGRKGRSKGRQVYLGGYANEEEAARTYDKAALAFLGPSAPTNFPLGDYAGFLVESVGQSPEEVVAGLRRGSVGYARGRSQFRGVTKAQQHGKYEARLGKADGAGQPLFLGIFDSAEEAAKAHDRAAVKLRGRTAVTNYALADYADILANPDSYDLDAVLSAAGAAAAAGAPSAAGSPTGQLLAVQTRARARTETVDPAADPVAQEVSERGRAESAVVGGSGLSMPPPLTLPLPMPPLQSYLEGTRVQQQGQQRLWAPSVQLGGTGADSASAAAAAAAMLAGQTSQLIQDTGSGLMQQSFPTLLGPWAAQWGPGLEQQQQSSQLQAPPVVLPSILVASKHAQATHTISTEQQQQLRRILSPSAGGPLASPLGLGTAPAPGVSPLAASLLYPLGLATEGRWRDSPLEKLFNSGAAALPSFPVFPQLQGQGQGQLYGGGVVGAGGAAGVGTGPPPAHAVAPSLQTQDDIWGALSWLESLDLAQLTSITAKNRTEGAVTPAEPADTEATAPAAGAAPVGHGAGSSYDSVQPEPSVGPY